MLTFFTIAVAVLLAAALWTIFSVKRFRAMSARIGAYEAGIDAALRRRREALAGQLALCRQHAGGEAAGLDDPADLRKGMTMQDRALANDRMDALAARINSLAESSPPLRSSEAFAALDADMRSAQDQLLAARHAYNATASAYNQRRAAFPDSLIARYIGLPPRPLFEADGPAEE